MIVLDTHAWFWWLTRPARVGKRGARAIGKADRIGVPAVSVWELAMKVNAGKIKLDRPLTTWLEEMLTMDPRIELLPLLPRISIESVGLSWTHADPADRFIVATARVYDSTLVTSDATIHESGLVRCLWD